MTSAVNLNCVLFGCHGIILGDVCALPPLRAAAAQKNRLSDRRTALEKLGRVRATGFAAAALRIHRLRQRRRGGVSGVAGPAHDRTLGSADPAAVEGTDVEKALAFAETYRILHNRIDIFVNLPLSSLDKLALQRRLEEIGSVESPEETIPT